MPTPDTPSSQESPERSSVIFPGAAIGDEYRDKLREYKDIRDDGQAKMRAGRGVREKRSQVLSSWGIQVAPETIALEGEEMSVDYTYAVPGTPMPEVEATVVVGESFMDRAEINHNAHHGGRDALAHMGLNREIRNLKIAQRIRGKDGAPVGTMEVYWRKAMWDRPLAVEISYLDSVGRKHHELLSFEENRWVLRERDASGATTYPHRLVAGFDPLARLDLRIQERESITSFGELGEKEYAIISDPSREARVYFDFVSELGKEIELRSGKMLQKIVKGQSVSLKGLRDVDRLRSIQDDLPALEEEVASQVRQWSENIAKELVARTNPGRWETFQRAFHDENGDRSILLLSRFMVDPEWARLERKVSDAVFPLDDAERENLFDLVKRKLSNLFGGK